MPRTTHIARPVALALCIALATTHACVSPATEVLITIDTDLPPDRPLELTARVSAHGASPLSDDAGAVRMWSRGDDGGLTFPASFAVVPRGDEPLDSVAVVTIEAQTEGFSLRRTARFRFTPHHAEILPIYLSLRCAEPDARCLHTTPCTRLAYCEEQGSTCGQFGDCVSIDTPLGRGLDAGPPPVVDVIATPACGDGVCNGSENACSCRQDGCTSVAGDGCCTGDETCHSAPTDRCDPSPCQCEVTCCGSGGAETTTQRTRCDCRNRFMYCTGQRATTFQIIYGGVLIYLRSPSGSGSHCGTGSSQAINDCVCPAEC